MESGYATGPESGDWRGGVSRAERRQRAADDFGLLHWLADYLE
ncbi:hypothetical protein LCGC14_3032570, partial [marine sediment metagenome]